VGSFNDFVWWSFLGFITIGLYLLNWIGNKTFNAMSKMNDEISELNKNFIILLERDRHHERELERQEERISKIENVIKSI
jgi:hypothetical protein